MHLFPNHTTLVLAQAGIPIVNIVPARIKALGGISDNLRLGDIARLFYRNSVRVNHFFILYLNLADLPSAPPRCLGGEPPHLLPEAELGDLYGRLEQLDGDDRVEVLSRLSFYRSGFKNCYVMRADGAIAYLQWLIFPSENDIIKAQYNKKFLPLNAKEVLIENSFTFPDYRGRGFLPFGTWHLLSSAKKLGYKRAVVYIRKDKIDPLNRFMHLGFTIKRIVREYKILGCTWRTL